MCVEHFKNLNEILYEIYLIIKYITNFIFSKKCDRLTSYLDMTSDESMLPTLLDFRNLNRAPNDQDLT